MRSHQKPSSSGTVDLNVDLGENEADEVTQSLLRAATSVNVCCGRHAGGPEKLRRTLQWARQQAVRIGAHPGVAAEGGRGMIHLSPDELWRLLEEQVGLFTQALADTSAREASRQDAAEGPELHLKLHGSLYHATDQEPALADALVSWMMTHTPHWRLYARAGGPTAALAQKRGLEVWAEGFIDRGYTAAGSLVPRAQAGALLSTCEALSRLQHWLTTGQWLLADGQAAPLHFDTLCLHADGPEAVPLAVAARQLVLGSGRLVADGREMILPLDKEAQIELR